jgi:hypothetical protein
MVVRSRGFPALETPCKLMGAEVVRNPFHVDFLSSPAWPALGKETDLQIACVGRLHPATGIGGSCLEVGVRDPSILKTERRVQSAWLPPLKAHSQRPCRLLPRGSFSDPQETSRVPWNLSPRLGLRLGGG